MQAIGTLAFGRMNKPGRTCSATPKGVTTSIAVTNVLDIAFAALIYELWWSG
jgi:hypothetical protein